MASERPFSRLAPSARARAPSAPLLPARQATEVEALVHCCTLPAGRTVHGRPLATSHLDSSRALAIQKKHRLGSLQEDSKTGLDDGPLRRSATLCTARARVLLILLRATFPRSDSDAERKSKSGKQAEADTAA
jgi:hypothetical protein